MVAENSDLYDVLEYIAKDTPPLTRIARAIKPGAIRCGKGVWQTFACCKTAQSIMLSEVLII